MRVPAFSALRQPQLFVLPLRKLKLETKVYLPQSHWHLHFASRFKLDPARSITTSNPNRWPVKFFKADIYCLHPFLLCAIISTEYFPLLSSGLHTGRQHFLFSYRRGKLQGRSSPYPEEPPGCIRTLANSCGKAPCSHHESHTPASLPYQPIDGIVHTVALPIPVFRHNVVPF